MQGNPFEIVKEEQMGGFKNNVAIGDVTPSVITLEETKNKKESPNILPTSL